MADIAKYAPINATLISNLFNSHFSILRTKRSLGVAYASLFLFIAFTIFLAFTPSSSPWFTATSHHSYPSHVSSIFNSSTDNAGSLNTYSLPPKLNKDQEPLHTDSERTTHKVEPLNPNNATFLPQKPFPNQSATPPETFSESSRGWSYNHTHSNDKGEVLKQNQTQSQEFKGNVDVLLKANQSTIGAPDAHGTVNSSSSGVENVSANGEKQIAENGTVMNSTSSRMKVQPNGTQVAEVKQGIDDLIKPLHNCNLFDGNWVRDESYPLYKPGSCSLIDDQFNCFLNGRPDSGYQKLKWQPKGCTLPRLNGSHLLELLRGKRLVFVGDSLNRNMWESLICILRNSVKDEKKVYEEFGRHHFRAEASISFIFEDYNCTVEFFVSPFLVQEWEVAMKNGKKKETLRLDLMSRSADKYKNADIIVFNTGHWWTHEKTSKGKDYYQEGIHVYSDLNVIEAFRKAMTTWAIWVDANVSPKSLVFFRGYSASHFSGGQWNSGGQCDHETEPIKNETYLSQYPSTMTSVLEQVLKGMRTPASYLNVTRMTDYRKDGHPSIYRKQHVSDLSFQDCSHWCLPGVPDAWNEILYAQLLLKLNSS